MKLALASLRKGGEALAQALEAWQSGQSVALPSECGYFELKPGLEEVWLSATPPEDPELQSIFDTFWPGPLRLRLRHGDQKRRWQVPAHPLAQAFLKLVDQPVAAQWLGRCPEDFEGLQLEWKDPPIEVAFSEVDCACTPWRWLRSGMVERREFEWVAGQGTLLSGAALPQLEHAPAPVYREKQTYRLEA